MKPKSLSLSKFLLFQGTHDLVCHITEFGEAVSTTHGIKCGSLFPEVFRWWTMDQNQNMVVNRERGKVFR